MDFRGRTLEKGFSRDRLVTRSCLHGGVKSGMAWANPAMTLGASPGFNVTRERAAQAIEEAKRFVSRVAQMLASA